jgi:hypothetical protein
MTNLQIKGIDDSLYAQIKDLALSENRSISQEVLFLIKSYMTNKKRQEKFKKTDERVLMFLLDTDTIIFSLKGNTAVQKNRGTQTHQLDRFLYQKVI